MTITKIISQLKEHCQDYEFYPTTDEIIQAVIKDIQIDEEKSWDRQKKKSILDIGAGSGSVLRKIAAAEDTPSDLYAIEKADILRDLLKDTYIIGTDFLQQSLIDKHIDITFCNPPYSEYEQWSEKIIRESASHTVYLIIPSRWSRSERIKEAIQYREAKTKIIGEYDFLTADRKARAIVNILRIGLSEKEDDAFDRLFNMQFKGLKNKFDTERTEADYEKEKKEKSKFTSLVLGESYVKSIVTMYNEDMKKTQRNYEAVSKLDADLLKEFGVYPDKILECLKQRTKGLKSLYWNELLSRMSEITDRLTTKRRQKIFSKLNENGNVDFTEGNIYAVVLWVIEHASKHIDEQLIEVYDDLLSKTNCRNYKSNKNVFTYDRWRYEQEKPHHIYLEYRLVVSSYGCLKMEYSYRPTYNLSERSCEKIKDLLTIACNLGFKANTNDDRLWEYSQNYHWSPGKPEQFYCIYKGKEVVLLEIKAHKNGNMHIRMNQKFALALNVEYGRLNGWLHSGEQASEELQNDEAPKYFNSYIALKEIKYLMLPCKDIHTA